MSAFCQLTTLIEWERRDVCIDWCSLLPSASRLSKLSRCMHAHHAWSSCHFRTHVSGQPFRKPRMLVYIFYVSGHLSSTWAVCPVTVKANNVRRSSRSISASRSAIVTTNQPLTHLWSMRTVALVIQLSKQHACRTFSPDAQTFNVPYPGEVHTDWCCTWTVVAGDAACAACSQIWCIIMVFRKNRSAPAGFQTYKYITPADAVYLTSDQKP